MFRLLLVISGLTFGPLTSTSAWAEHHVLSGQWLAGDGLPVDTVNSLALDGNGYLWAGTHDGLVRFDGFEFVHFNADTNPALPSNRINQLFTVGQHLIVRFENDEFGTLDGDAYQRIGHAMRENLHADDSGLWYAQGEDLIRWEPDSGIRHLATFENLAIIHPDPNGERLFLGMDSARVVEHDPNANHSRMVINDLDGPVLALALAPDGLLGILTSSSFRVIELESGRLRWSLAFPQHQWDHRDLTWTTDGWLTTMGGTPPFGRMVQITRHGIEPVKAAPFDFHYFVMNRTDDQGRFWVNQGTRLYRDGELIHETDEPIIDFHFDRYGQVWLGTLRGGLKRVSEAIMRNACPADDCIDDPNTYLITEHADGLLIGNQHALYYHDPDEQSWTRLMHFYPLSALADGDELLVGGNGLCRLQTDGLCVGGPPAPEPEIRMLIRDAIDAVWMGSDHGLYRRSPDGQWSDQPLSHAFIRAAVELDEQRLVFGSAGDGVLMGHIRSPSDPIEVIASIDNGLASNSVRSLHVLPDHRLLVGLEDRGMCLLDPDRGVERCISVAEGLPHHSAHRIIEDDFGRLWVNTNNGIYLVAIDHLLDFFEKRVDELTVRRFDMLDGMPSAEGNGSIHQAGTRTADGRIWFPNQRGVVVIEPQRAEPSRHVLSASIDALGHAGNLPIELSAEARMLRVRLRATALRGAHAVQFRYRMAKTQPWNFVANQSELSFESLAPGNYQLEVQARYRDGQWPDEATLLAFAVPPRLAERSSFWVAMGMFGLLVLGGLLWREHGQVARLESQVNHRTSELRNALATVRVQATNIRQAADRRHHNFLTISQELRAPLLRILGPLRDLSSKSPDKSQLKRMQQGAEHMQTLIDQMLELEQIDHGQPGTFEPTRLPELIRHTLKAAEPAIEAKAITVEVMPSNHDQALWSKANRAQLERALAIVLENAIKFARNKGLVRVGVSVSPRSDHARVLVEDDGPGIPPEQHPSIFEPFYRGSGQSGLGLGLTLSRRIIEQHGGTISVARSELGGASFLMELPLTDAPDQTEIPLPDRSAHTENDPVRPMPASASVAEKPTTERQGPITSRKSSTFMSRLDQAMNDQIDNSELDVDQLAALSGTSRASLYRRLQEYRNMTPAEFIRDFRLRRAAEMLRQSDARISEIAFAVGFKRPSTFARAFQSRYRCSPSQYRKYSD